MEKGESLLKAKTIALIGATDRQGSVGLGIAKNLLFQKSGKDIFFVNPNKTKILKQKSFASILDIKKDIDLAIIAVPSAMVKALALQCAQAKVKNCLIISAGFAETGKEGAKRQKEIGEILRASNINLIGPNCLGIINPFQNLNASFAPSMPRKGKIALFSQSGALINSLIDKSLIDDFGFSMVVSYGNEEGLTLNDFLVFAQQDENSKVIAVYLEEIKNGRDFIQIASKISKEKPIIILKGGVSAEGKKAAMSHTAALSGENEIYQAAFQRAGIFQVNSISDLLVACKTLSFYPRVHNKWAILTNGGAVGVLTADQCSLRGVNLVSIPKRVFEKISSAKIINPAFSKGNPLDIIGDASSEGYKMSLTALLGEKQIAGVIFCQTLQTMTDPLQNAKNIVEISHQESQKIILPMFLGGKETKRGVDYLEKNGFYCPQDPTEAAFCAKILSQ